MNKQQGQKLMFDWVGSKDLSEEGALSSIARFRYLKQEEKKTQ